MKTLDTRPLRAALALLALLALLGPLAAPATAAPPAQETAAPSYSFLDMGLGAPELASPSDRQVLSFSLPAGQQLAEGASVTLNLRTSILDTVALPADEAEDLGGAIVIAFNGQTLETLPLTAEPERSVTLEIPAELLAAPEGGRYTLGVELRTRVDCVFGDAIRVAVGEDSSFTLPTEAAPISVSLADLPAPMFQRSFLPETAIMVVPDEPSEAELRSALIVAAALGRSTGNRLGLTLARSGDLTEAQYEASHLVMVGSPTDLPLLAEVELPAAVEDGLFSAPDLKADDGLVQAAVSPWDESKLVLAVGGNSDAGLLKAAQSFALGQLLLTEERPNLSLVAEVNPVEEELPPVTRTFTDLGYSSARRTNYVGVSSLYYSFALPAGQVATDESFVEIAFAHAALLNYDESSMAVVLNGSEIGGARFSDETVGVTRARFLMPRDLLRPGNNELQLRVNLAAPNSCADRENLDLWLNVWPDSVVSVPLEPAAGSQLRSVSLDEYPALLSSSPTLADLAFVVRGDDPAAWQAAAGVVANLANWTNGAPVDFAVAFDGAVADEVRQNHNLIVLGQPSRLELIQELNDQLPAPFEADSDVAIDRVSRVAFRLAQREDVGYVQLLTAPWNDERLVLAALGNSPAGVGQAGQALSRGDLQSQLGGSLALVVDQQIFVGGTRLVVAQPEEQQPGATPVPGATTTTITDTVEPVVANTDATEPRSGPPLFLALGISVVVMLVVVGGFAAWGVYRRNRSA